MKTPRHRVLRLADRSKEHGSGRTWPSSIASRWTSPWLFASKQSKFEYSRLIRNADMECSPQELQPARHCNQASCGCSTPSSWACCEPDRYASSRCSRRQSGYWDRNSLSVCYQRGALWSGLQESHRWEPRGSYAGQTAGWSLPEAKSTALLCFAESRLPMMIMKPQLSFLIHPSQPHLAILLILRLYLLQYLNQRLHWFWCYSDYLKHYRWLSLSWQYLRIARRGSCSCVSVSIGWCSQSRSWQ